MNDGSDIDLPEAVKEFPVIALKDQIVFPEQALQFGINRPLSTHAIELYRDLFREHACKYIVVTGQKSSDKENPDSSDIYDIGTLFEVLRLERPSSSGSGDQYYVVEGRGVARVKIEFTKESPFFMGKITILKDEEYEITPAITQETQTLKTMIYKLIDLIKGVPSGIRSQISKITDPSVLSDIAIARIGTDLALKQNVLQELNVGVKVQKVLAHVSKELGFIKSREEVHKSMMGETEKHAKRMFLQEQIKTIKKELGEEEEEDDIEALEAKIAALNLPASVLKATKKEITRLKRTMSISAEYSVIRTYIDWILDLPWNTSTEDNLSISDASKTLDEGHYGLEKAKKRILEFLAVRQLRQDNKGPILCLSGPPGVGKTTLAKDIAKALGRKCERISLGGISDEADIRGHRRTYVGALPGKFISAMKKLESNNPVLILDEIDKVGRSHKGDIQAALLEILDPEQNNEFVDHYLEVPFDFSKTMFICTANQADTIDPALKDRMEIIEISGYTEEEKIQIIKRHLIAVERERNGLKEGQLGLTDGAVKKLIRGYTRESGIRKAQQFVAKAARKIAVGIVDKKKVSFKVTEGNLEKYLGPLKFERDAAEQDNPPGIVTGLAWTAVGGCILFAEAMKTAGKGNIKISGMVGKSMEESANAAVTFIKSRAAKYGIMDDFEKIDLHIHFPESTPKDGPSAGITLVVALVSLLTGKEVPGTIAMTGEISLRGKILPIGGLKEKLLAAIRSGIKQVYIPEKNKNDLKEIQKELGGKLDVRLVDSIDQVIDGIFGFPPENPSTIMTTEPFAPYPMVVSMTPTMPEVFASHSIM